MVKVTFPRRSDNNQFQIIFLKMSVASALLFKCMNLTKHLMNKNQKASFNIKDGAEFTFEFQIKNKQAL